MRRRLVLKWFILASALITGYQVLCPPVIGLADQADFRRLVGKFGYGPEQPASYFGFINLKYVRDPSYRAPDWEQFSSEDLIVGATVLVNKVVSKDGKLDIRLLGAIHSLLFVLGFAYLLRRTSAFRFAVWLWLLFLILATDVARVEFFNSFYAEPASYIFCIFLIAESIVASVE